MTTSTKEIKMTESQREAAMPCDEVNKSLAQAYLDLSAIRGRAELPQVIQICSEALAAIVNTQGLVFQVKALLEE